MVFDVVDDVEVWVAIGKVVVFIMAEGVEEAGPHGVRERGRDTNGRLFRSGTSKPFTESLHVAFEHS